MPVLQIILVVVFGGVGFTAAWRKLGDADEMGAKPKEIQRFYEVRFRKGFDGKHHLEPPPFHLRVALSLLSAVGGAVVMAYFYTWLNRHGF